MKTLIITLEYPPEIGGIATYTYNLAKNIPPSDVVVYAPKMAGDSEFDKKNPWKVLRAKPNFLFIWPRWIKMLFQIWNLVKKEKIQMIYVHHALPAGYVAYLLKKFKKIPYTIFFHGTDLDMGIKNKKNKLKKICIPADKIVVNSNYLKNKFQSAFEGIKKEIVVVYPCPDDIFLQKASEVELKKMKSQLALEGKKVIITVARMAEGKGYPHLIRLLPKILEKVPNLVWIIIGDGPKKDEIIKSIQKNYLQNVTRFIGKMPYTDLPKYYQLADLLVLLTHPDESSSEEAWGTAFVEAAASGLPVVAGRAGGVEEAVTNMLTGLVVDVYQDQSIVSAITELLRNPDYAKQMGQAGKQRVIQEFNWVEQLKKL
ncbi:MAG: Glycosyltransferase, group 1 family protein [Candidatus Magasanikbacteria bacterium GW2011_GWA2_40_10]|uniref:Glycosyltransferase, group 1 family protein n=1 Tax=Candidatus Magasanikbacteria bacterium GW2011_GWA2_40_10 TaxID=1619037 RepID=A0A0G0SIW7_9BACT|nr:MAG: Glycosyltransferase, group 1 family protein [Candidatus Magasanikbacteria bacterium GW2011_GWA2_40_10]